MPGKTNPTQCEEPTLVAVRFRQRRRGRVRRVAGQFPAQRVQVILHNALESVELLGDAVRSFDIRCARGIEPDRERIREHVEGSLMLVTALNPHIGYENSAKIALYAHHHGTTLREAVLKLGLVTAEDFDRWIDPEAMTRPGP
jgi:fumarate hydratase class II